MRHAHVELEDFWLHLLRDLLKIWKVVYEETNRAGKDRWYDSWLTLALRCGEATYKLTQGKVACPLQFMTHLCIPKLQFGVQQVVQTIQFLSLDLCLPGNKWQYCCSDTHPQSQHSLLLRYEITWFIKSDLLQSKSYFLARSVPRSSLMHHLQVKLCNCQG